MFNKADLPETIPVFPLPGALMLPRARLPLHIFEPRYLQMIDDTLKTSHRLIGMIQPYEVPGSGEKKLHSIGCAGRLTQFSETEDGRYMITLAGMSRFRVTQEVEGFAPYRRCDISWEGFSADLGPTEEDKGFDRESFLNTLSRYFDSMDLSTDWESLSEAEDELLINSLSMLCPFEPEEKQALLEAPSLTTRRETIAALLEFALAASTDDERMQ
jgi:Lon protease-like protein